ncbi:hypothetical protein B0T19DRAFT_953 [Cercophora scortea]|uniref:Uncharacterized protein n=1 Tax=Cercophora scortea TaxID=314031 RepID=A0AAE0J2Q1_9PEZI|nr:hypothetical protein B0T19DRAFT_953 [Cercophora scortea]
MSAPASWQHTDPPAQKQSTGFGSCPRDRPNSLSQYDCVTVAAVGVCVGVAVVEVILVLVIVEVVRLAPLVKARVSGGVVVVVVVDDPMCAWTWGSAVGSMVETGRLEMSTSAALSTAWSPRCRGMETAVAAVAARSRRRLVVNLIFKFLLRLGLSRLILRCSVYVFVGCADFGQPSRGVCEGRGFWEGYIL